MSDFDIAIVGAGIVGVAIARELAPHMRVLLLEQHARPGTETSSRNSEVIHAGLYYPPDSLKARWCRRGHALLTEFCERHAVPYRLCGKLVVACEAAELPALERLATNAGRCGVALPWLESTAIARHEPALRAKAALLSTATGIIDSHALLNALLAQATAAGATLACHSRLEQAYPAATGFVLEGHSSTEPFRLSSRWLINSAGLHAQAVAGTIDGLDPAHIPPLVRLKGHYFRLAGPSPFTHLIYPVPEAGLAGLGIHATLDLAGQTRFGPDTEATDTLDYRVPPERALAFEAAIRRYWPGLPANALQPDSAGIRPRLVAEGFSDFCWQDATTHGIPGLLQLFGIDSPGLTSALAIAEAVRHHILAH